MTKFKYYCKIVKLYFSNKNISFNDISKSFDKIYTITSSPDLDKITSTSIPMLDEIINKLQINPIENLKVLDLASGSGFNCNYIYSKLQIGSYTLVDISKNALTEAKANCNFHCSFIESDILSYLKTCTDNSMDVIVCSYGISYASPKEIIKESCRVLKNGGFFGVIDNLNTTYPELKNFSSKLLCEHIDLFNKLHIKLNRPRNEYFFEKMFVDSRFNRINLKSHTDTLNFNSKACICDFISTSDILSPLHSLINLEDPIVKSTTLSLLEENNITSLTHKYIWGSFRNDKSE